MCNKFDSTVSGLQIKKTNKVKCINPHNLEKGITKEQEVKITYEYLL